MQVNNKRNRVILTILIIISTYLFLLVFLKNVISAGESTGKSICIFKMIFHKDCPGCGMTRAFYNMLQFNFIKAVNFNIKIIIVYPLIWVLYINYVYKKINLIFKGDVKNGRKGNKEYQEEY